MSALKVLVVEDEAKAAAYLHKGLSENGFVVDVAGHGDQGLDLAWPGEYDLIVLDVMLPGRDGWEVLRQLWDAGRESPMLLLTARDSVEERVKGLDLGADDIVQNCIQDLATDYRRDGSLTKALTRVTAICPAPPEEPR